MPTTKATTPKPLQTKQLQQTRTNNGSVGESFRVLYYGNASAGSVPFKWESQPGTPKHALTESSLPPLTPPPSYNQLSKKYNSSMHEATNHHPSTRSCFFRTIFFPSSRKKNTVSSSISSCSVSSSSSSYSWKSTPMMSTVKFGLEDDCSYEHEHEPKSTLCLGGGFKKSYRIKRMKKAMLSFVRN